MKKRSMIALGALAVLPILSDTAFAHGPHASAHGTVESGIGHLVLLVVLIGIGTTAFLAVTRQGRKGRKARIRARRSIRDLTRNIRHRRATRR